MNYYQLIQQALIANQAMLRTSNFIVIYTMAVSGLQPSPDGKLTIVDLANPANNFDALKGTKAGQVPTKVTVLKCQRDFTKSNGTAWKAGEAFIIWE